MENYSERILETKSINLALPYFSCGKHVVKEVSESWGALEAAKLFKDRMDENTLIFIPGDGVVPRTGAIFSLYTKSHVISCDPIMKMEKVETLPKLGRLSYFNKKAEELDSSIIPQNIKRVLIVLCHSHCPMFEAIKFVKQIDKIDIINIPCCVPIPPFFLSKKNPPKIYMDKSIRTQKNKVYIWENIESSV
jgi:hypothetical protein